MTIMNRDEKRKNTFAQSELARALSARIGAQRDHSVGHRTHRSLHVHRRPARIVVEVYYAPCGPSLSWALREDMSVWFQGIRGH